MTRTVSVAGAAAALALAAGLVGAAALSAGRAAAQSPAPSSAAGYRLWFDPTQLPSFTGVVERFLMDPDGKVTRLLFREGPQVIFPEHVGAEVRRAVEPGQGIVVYGIRARRAPVITMLAWARDGGGGGGGGEPPRFVDRPTWGFGDFEVAGEPMQLAGEIAAPLYTPQGEVMGAILRDGGGVIRVPPGVAAALGDKLAAGRRIAAVGRGRTGPLGMALDAERIGETGDTLQPLPVPAGTTAPGAERRP